MEPSCTQCTVLLLDATHTTDPHHLGRSICTYSMVGGERELAGLPIFLGYAGMFCNIEYLHQKMLKIERNFFYILFHIMVQYFAQKIIFLVLNCRDNMTCVKDNSCLLRCHFVRGGNFVVIPRG